MTDEERKAALDNLAPRFWAMRAEIERLLPELRMEVDRKEAKSIMTDLVWATENCTVMGLHQVGKSLNDCMGWSRGGDGTAA